MATLPKQVFSVRKKAIEKALRAGFAPPGVRRPRGNAVDEAARTLTAGGDKIDSSVLYRQIKAGKITPNWKLYKPAAGSKYTDRHPDTEGLKRLDFEAQIKQLRREIETARSSELQSHRALERILGLHERLKSVPTPEWAVKPRSSDEHSVLVPCTLWSDWQYGEVVNTYEVGGINSYNATIAQERLATLVQRTEDMCFRYMKNPNYSGIVVNLGGDFISGGIHPELAETDDRTAPEAVVDLYGLIRRALLRLADRFGRVFVPCVIGNHGRNTIKPRHKLSPVLSYEWLIYRFLRESFEGDPRFQIVVSPEVDCYYKVFNHRYRLTHGDRLGVKGGDGIIGALGPIMRGAVKVRHSEAPLGRDHDTLLMGHWHQYIPLRHLIVNGSLVGYSEYARLALRAQPEPPCQALWFTHPNFGVIWANPVFVTPVIEMPTNDWVSWRA